MLLKSGTFMRKKEKKSVVYCNIVRLSMPCFIGRLPSYWNVHCKLAVIEEANQFKWHIPPVPPCIPPLCGYPAAAPAASPAQKPPRTPRHNTGSRCYLTCLHFNHLVHVHVSLSFSTCPLSTQCCILSGRPTGFLSVRMGRWKYNDIPPLPPPPYIGS